MVNQNILQENTNLEITKTKQGQVSGKEGVDDWVKKTKTKTQRQSALTNSSKEG